MRRSVSSVLRSKRPICAADATQEDVTSAYNSARQWLISQGADPYSVDYGANYNETRYYVNGVQTDLSTYTAAYNDSVDSLRKETERTWYVFNKAKALLGDTDRNGTVDNVDAAWLMRSLADMRTPLTELDLLMGDVDETWTLELTDATLIQMYTAEMAVDYPIGEPYIY